MACELRGEITESAKGEPPSEDLGLKITALEPKITELELKIDEQTFDFELLKDRVDAVENKTAVLDTSEKGYTTVNSNSGTFLVACDNVEPYLDGRKVKLKIGNPTLATYSGLTLTVRWGRREPRWVPKRSDRNAWSRFSADHEAWKKQLQEKQIDSPAELLPGRWNTVEVIISPAKPEEAIHLEVSILTKKLSLQERQPTR